MIRWALAVGLLIACAGCVTPLPGADIETERPFAGVPPPPGCSLVGSHVRRGAFGRYAVLVYRGTPTVSEIETYYEQTMRQEDWRLEGAGGGGAERTLRYVKERAGRTERCDVVVGPADWLGRRHVMLILTGTGRP